MSNSNDLKVLIPKLLIGFAWHLAGQRLSAQPPTPDKLVKMTGHDLIDSASYGSVPGDSELRKLLKSRVEVAITEWRDADNSSKQRGTMLFRDRLEIGERILVARLALDGSPTSEVTLLRQWIAYLRKMEDSVREMFVAGQIQRQYLERVKTAYFDANLRLLRLRDTIPGADSSIPALAADILARQLNEESELAEAINSQLFVISRDEPETVKLRKLRANCAIAESHIRQSEYFAGRGRFEDLIDTAQRETDYRWELTTNPGERQIILNRRQALAQDCFDALKDACLIPGTHAKLHFHFLNAKLGVLRQTPDAFNRQNAFPLPKGIGRPDVPPDPLDETENDSTDPAFTRSKLNRIDQSESQVPRLMKQLMNAAVTDVRYGYREQRIGRGSLDDLYVSARRARDIRMALAPTKDQFREVLTEYLEFVQALEKLNQARYDAGAIRGQHLQHSRFERLTAEIDLLQTNVN